MIIYYNNGFARVVFATIGSQFWKTRSLTWGLIMAFVTFCMQLAIMHYEIDHWLLSPNLHHNLSWAGIFSVLNMLMGFRVRLAWSRYWEALSNLQTMYSKWGDSFMQISAFTTTAIETARSKKTADGDLKSTRLTTALGAIEKYFTLLSALACERVVHGDIGRMKKRCETAKWQKQISLRQQMRGEDLTGAKKLPIFELEKVGTQKHTGSHQQMWIGTTYTIRAHPTDRELEVLTACGERVQICGYWLLRCVTMLSKDLDVAPPIQSRMFQELSNGMLGFNTMLKVADVPYPFPHAQLLNIVLMIFAFALPTYVVTFTRSLLLAPLLAFFIFVGIWTLNEVAKDLENPFGLGDNAIPLVDYHARFMDMIQDIDMARACQAKDWRLQAESVARALKEYEESQAAAAALTKLVVAPSPVAVAAPPPPASPLPTAAHAPTATPAPLGKPPELGTPKHTVRSKETTDPKLESAVSTTAASIPTFSADPRNLELFDQHLTKITACLEFSLELQVKMLKEATALGKGSTALINHFRNPVTDDCSMKVCDFKPGGLPKLDAG